MNTAFSQDSQWPELVTSIYAALADTFKNNGLASDNHHRLAEVATLRLINDFGGTQMYLPTGATAKRLIRDHAIYQQAQTGQFSANELAQQFKLSAKQIHEILRNRNQDT